MTNNMKSEARPIYTDDDLYISYLSGKSDRLVVAFTGIGLGMGGIQQEEFAGTASQGSANHVAFVTDRKRSWYSTEGLQDRIMSHLLAIIAENGIRRVVCLGNSMGGYGALLFARGLKAKAAIAFVPQYTMDPAIIAEQRWRQFHGNIRVEGLCDLGDAIAPDVVSHVVFGADDARDKPHSRMFIAHGQPNVYLVRDADHRVAGLMKRRQLLAPVIAAMINGDQPAVSDILKNDLVETYPSKGASQHDTV